MAIKSVSLFIVLLLCSVFAFSAAGAFAPYARGGKVISCQKIAKPQIINFDADELDVVWPADPVYIALTIKPDRDRKISVVDYTLEVMNAIKLPCIAVRIGDSVFDAAAEEKSIPDNTDVTLLFAADARDCVDELPDNTMLNITGAAAGKVSRRSTTFSTLPPAVNKSGIIPEDAAYIFFEMEIVSQLPSEAGVINVSCSDFHLVIPDVKSVDCVAARKDGNDYSNRGFSLEHDDTATLLFAVKAVDCIDDMPFKLHYNLSDSGSRISIL